jgi:LCP family protein required for cell wall assembly
LCSKPTLEIALIKEKIMKTGSIFSLRNIIVAVLAVVFFAGAFVAARFLTVTMQAVGGIPGIALSESTPDAASVDSLPTPEPAAPEIPLPPGWDGASRVTILLLGIDTEVRLDSEGKVSPDRVGPARSDTMILLTIDPQSKTAGMMSIPRDLWVNIPGFGYAKINTAYYDVEAFKVPGGGPELAMRTVEQVIGVPVQYYAQIQFWAFTHLIDSIGKVEVNVPKKIFIDPVGPGADDIMLSAGLHKLGGVEALAYVRQRHTKDGDVDRSKRQQDVIIAARNQVLNPANFPTILANAPTIYNEIQSGVRTNLTFNDIMKLGILAKDIDLTNIKKGVIDYKMMLLDNVVVNGENQSIAKPIPDKIRELRDEIFVTNTAVGPLAQGELVDLAKAEGATIAVYNASSVQGVAQRTADYLKSLGLNVILVDNASYLPGVTQVISHSSNLYTLKFFSQLFNLKSSSQVVNKTDQVAAANIEIIVADDWAVNNPMP